MLRRGLEQMTYHGRPRAVERRGVVRPVVEWVLTPFAVVGTLGVILAVAVGAGLVVAVPWLLLGALVTGSWSLLFVLGAPLAACALGTLGRRGIVVGAGVLAATVVVAMASGAPSTAWRQAPGALQFAPSYCGTPPSC